MISAVLFISFFVFLILGVPIALCLGLSSVCAILYSGTSLTIVATNMYSGISKFLLLAIPFFVLSGNIMAKAGISRRLIDFVDTCVGLRYGHLRYTRSFSRLLSSRTSVLIFPRSLPEPTPGSDLLKVSLRLNLSVGTESLPSVHRLRLSASP